MYYVEDIWLGKKVDSLAARHHQGCPSFQFRILGVAGVGERSKNVKLTLRIHTEG